ncbi:MAG: glycoside hydrolase family 127 protein, partial [Kiritimatiellae bacterium]|nr:glycoside hydrolase family 127 protein [Kiritimatiellia bacterium]
ADFEKHFPHATGPESCASVNMLRLTEALFEAEPSAGKMDFYERVLFDHLLSTHDPVLGRTVYHTPVRHATSRTYSSEFDSMWCCTGTGLEAPGKYARMIYTRAADDSAVRVNLFAPSVLEWKSRGARLRQKTAFPHGESACVEIESAGESPDFALKIRRPAWSGAGFSVKVNGEAPVAGTDAEGYVVLRRGWKAGDVVRIEFPMSLRAEYLPGSKKYAAFFYGPVLLVGDNGTDGMSKRQYVSETVSCVGPDKSYCSSVSFEPYMEMASIPAAAVGNPAAFLEPTACGPLVFRLSGTDVLLKPLFAVHFSRYTTYWRIMGEKESADCAVADGKAADYAKRAADSVEPGDFWSERKHSFSGDKSESGSNIYGAPRVYGWRDARGGAGFAYRMSAAGCGRGAKLVARYRNCERGARSFDVRIDGATLFTENLKNSGGRGFFFREMPIPPEMLEGKKHVEVRFVPKPGNIAGGLFGLWLVPGDR